MLQSFPDYKAENIKAVSDGDSVTVYATWSGTFTKDGFGVKATGKHMNFNDVDVFKLDASGKIISHKSTSAGTEAFKQIINK